VKASPKIDTTPEVNQHVPENRHQPRREQLVQHVDVRGHPGHQTANRVAVVEAEVELLQVRKHLHPQVEHHPLPGDLHGPCLHVLEGERGEKRHQIERSDDAQS
jgi:hypothetical protein